MQAQSPNRLSWPGDGSHVQVIELVDKHCCEVKPRKKNMNNRHVNLDMSCHLISCTQLGLTWSDLMFFYDFSWAFSGRFILADLFSARASGTGQKPPTGGQVQAGQDLQDRWMGKSNRKPWILRSKMGASCQFSHQYLDILGNVLETVDKFEQYKLDLSINVTLNNMSCFFSKPEVAVE